MIVNSVRRVTSALLVLVLYVLGPAGPAAAGTQPPEVVKLLGTGVPDAEQRCAYTRVRSDSDSLKIERYDPADAGAPWTLLNLDGRAPSPNDLRRYAQRADNRSDRQHPLAFDPRDMVRPGSWELHSENGAERTYHFKLAPFEELTERLADKALGTLVVDKKNGRLLQIRIENVEPTYVAPLVRITSYAQELRFDHDPKLGKDVLVKRVTHLRGRAAGMKQLKDDRVVRYEDYVCRESGYGDIARGAVSP
jgi:hypothetical protein